MAWLAEQSGEPLEDHVKEAARAAGTQARFGEHPEQGESAFLWAAIFALMVVGFVALHVLSRRRTLPAWTGLAAYGLVSAVGAVALLTMVVAGHSGAALVWKEVGSFAAWK